MIKRSCLCVGLWVALSAAQAVLAQQPARHLVQLQSQDLGAALASLAHQTKIQVVYPAELVRGKRAPALSGTWTSSEALDRVLEGSGLRFEYLDDQTVTLSPLAPRDVETPRRKDASPEATVPAADAPERQARETPEARHAVQLEEVLVTGSRLGRSETEGPQRVNTYTRENIERSGQTTVAGFLSTLPEVFNSESNESFSGAWPEAPTVQLRGLPMGSTLVLVNGRRLGKSATTNGSHFNLRNVPTAAIERIEILPEGASAVYGSDALSGVVNIILKTKLEGVEMDAKFGHASGTDEVASSLAWGRDWGSGHVLAMVSGMHRTPLLQSERALTADEDFSRFGGLDQRTTSCNPGNVYSMDGTNLPGLDSPRAAIPSGAPGQTDFAATSGATRKCARYGNTVLIPKIDELGAYVSLSQALSPGVELFIDALYSQSRSIHMFGSHSVSRIGVPAQNPHNPFGVDVLVDYAFAHDPQWYRSYDTSYFQPVVGLKGALGARWDWELALWSGQERNTQATNSLNLSLLRSLLAGGGDSPDLFQSGVPVVSDALRQQLFPVETLSQEGQTRTGSALLRGPLFEMPAGEVRAAIGVEAARESLRVSGGPAPYDYERSVKSAFMEARVPLLAREGAETLGLTGALRRDEYGGFGGTNTAQFGMEWRPTRTFLLRASYAESYLAPQLYFVNAPVYTLPAGLVTRFDPVRNESVSPALAYGGNPHIMPQQGKSWSLGAVWDGILLPGAQASLSLWRVTLSDRLEPYPNLQFLIDNEALYPDRIQREQAQNGVPGRILRVDYAAMNLGELDVAGVDADIAYSHKLSTGMLNLDARGTWIGRYDAVVLPNQPVRDYRGASNSDVWAPRLRLSLGAAWTDERITVNVNGRYVSSFMDIAPLSNGTVQTLGDFWTWDASVGLALGGLALPGTQWLGKARVSLGVVNLFDKQVPFSMNSSGYASSVYDLRGRYVYLSMGTRW